MKRNLLGIIACIALLGASSARATTYTYVGQPFTVFQNPLVGWGTNNTGSVTFNIDTSTLTGVTLSTSTGDVSSLTMTSGIVVYELSSLTGSFGFTNGNITSWVVDSVVSSTGTLRSINDLPLVGDALTILTPDVSFAFANLPGAWSRVDVATPAPLPAALPLFAGGLAVVGLLRWRGTRRVLRSKLAFSAP